MSPPPRDSLVYPQEREADIALRDGSTVHVRPVRAEDGPSIRGFIEKVSQASIRFRFFGIPNLDWATSWCVDVDYAERFALIAQTGTPPQVVAHAAYVRTTGDRAEVAFLVADAMQGQGISTILLAHLAEVAQRNGISTFIADVLPTNHRMIEVFRESGFPVEVRAEPGLIKVELPTSLSPEAVVRFDERERTAAVAAVRSVIEPRSVAVIGASRRRGTVGGEVLHNLLSAEFQGSIYVVNPRADVVQTLPAYRSVIDIPDRVELAVVVVPAEQVVSVAQECATAGVRALVVISSGFAETGAAGTQRQRDLVAVCREAGIRLVGPNCLGVLNTAPGVRLNATFAPRAALPGRVGFMSQSGGLGIAIIELAGRLGLGLSSFVSVGNKADLSGNDFLRYWEEDPGTDVALLYLESFGNPRKFARIAPRFARRKPLLAVKSGRSAAGARATSSHTGALLSASDVTVDALFEQAGVIRADSLHELFGVAQLLSAQPVPRGDRVAIVTNGGGPGIMCADACEASGVLVPELPAEVRARLNEFLPPEASVRNPIDMIATATAEDYRRTLIALIEADACDAILSIFVPPLVTDASDVACAICGVAESHPVVTLAAVFMSDAGPPAELSSEVAQVPGYEFPEDAARAIALAAKHGRWRSRPEAQPATFADMQTERGAAIISQCLAAGAGWLAPSDVLELLSCYRLPVIPTRIVADGDQAVALAAKLGQPVALKAQAEGLVHKSDAGAVKLGLSTPAQVRAAAREIKASVTRAGHRLEGLLVQPMAGAGVELIVGVVSDRSFGPVVACGAGGTTAELLRDVAVRITPLSDLDAREMIHSLKLFPLLDGYRGAERCNVGAVEDVLLRVGALVEAHPEIVELDLNPVVASPEGATILDARVRIEVAPPTPPMPSLGA